MPARRSRLFRRFRRLARLPDRPRGGGAPRCAAIIPACRWCFSAIPWARSWARPTSPNMARTRGAVLSGTSGPPPAILAIGRRHRRASSAGGSARAAERAGRRRCCSANSTSRSSRRARRSTGSRATTPRSTNTSPTRSAASPSRTQLCGRPARRARGLASPATAGAHSQGPADLRLQRRARSRRREARRA